CALVEPLAREDRVGLGAGPYEQDLLDVSLRERSLPRRHLEHRRAVSRAGDRPDRESHAERREEREGREDPDDRPPAARRERPERLTAAHHEPTTSFVCMPPR